MESLPFLPRPPAAAGVMGLATARALQSLGYQVSGWSRAQPTEQQQAERAGITTFVGQQQLQAFVSQQDVLVCLLPLTAETTGAGPTRYREMGWAWLLLVVFWPALQPLLFGSLREDSHHACRVRMLHCAVRTTSSTMQLDPIRLWVLSIPGGGAAVKHQQ